MADLRIYHGDCRNILPTLNDKIFDVVVTSPPYNIQVNYNTYKDNLSFEEYLEFLEEVFVEIHRVLRDDGSFFLNICSRPSEVSSEFEVINRLRKHFEIQNRIFWIKHVSLDDDSRGHYKPIRSERFLNSCGELILHATKNKTIKLDRKALGVPYKDKSCVNRYGKGSDLRCRGNTWFIPYSTVKESKTHPAGFPVRLPEWCIKLHGLDKTSLVLDPFMGVGTTLKASKLLGVSAVGIDIDKLYVDEAKKLID